MKKNYVTISIPRELYEKVAEMIEDTSFRSPTEFIIFTLRLLLMERSERKMMEGLRALGYLKEE
ncbi:CopG family transcriptional regulator [Candidatus Pyrohabitans sp.]